MAVHNPESVNLIMSMQREGMKLKAELQQIKAENERLKKEVVIESGETEAFRLCGEMQLERIEELKDENEKLKSSIETWKREENDWKENEKDLITERDRLRGAMLEIKNWAEWDVNDGQEAVECLDKISEIVEKALKESEE